VLMLRLLSHLAGCCGCSMLFCSPLGELSASTASAVENNSTAAAQLLPARGDPTRMAQCAIQYVH